MVGIVVGIVVVVKKKATLVIHSTLEPTAAFAPLRGKYAVLKAQHTTIHNP